MSWVRSSKAEKQGNIFEKCQIIACADGVVVMGGILQDVNKYLRYW